MPDRPVLLVDIDGVLNVYGVNGCPPGYTEHELFPQDAEPARLCAAHGAWLRELAEHFDLAWASALGRDTHRLLGPILALDEFPAVPMPPVPFPPAEKVPAIAAYVGDRPAAWVDDVLGPEARAWAGGRTAPTLLLGIDHRIGLRRADVDELLRWARTV